MAHSCSGWQTDYAFFTLKHIGDKQIKPSDLLANTDYVKNGILKIIFTPKKIMIKAQKQHQARIIDLICLGFKDDPQLLAYTNGEPAKMRLIARLAFETCLASNTIFLTDDLNVVALCKPSIGKGFYVKPFLINLMFPFVFGFKPLKNLMQIESVLKKTRQTTQDGLYIWMLATDPKQQGKGLGSLLLNHVEDLLPNTYHTIFLETAKESNMLYYAKRGYVLYDSITPAPNLKVFFMCKAKAIS